MVWSWDAFWNHQGVWVLIGAGACFVQSFLSSLVDLIINVILSVKKVRSLPRWLSKIVEMIDIAHACLFGISVIALVVYVVYVLSARDSSVGTRVGAVVLIVEFAGFIVLPTLIATLIWESVTKKGERGNTEA